MADNIRAFKKAKTALGMKTVISLKWYFKRKNASVPIRDSAEEQKLFATMRYVLDELAEYSDILIAGNEPIIETYVEDMQLVGRGDDAFTPMSDFYIRVADYIHRYLVERQLRDKVKVIMGAFNRLDVPKKRDYPAVQSMLQAAIDNPNIDESICISMFRVLRNSRNNCATRESA